MIKRLKCRLFRNSYTDLRERANVNSVNLVYWKKVLNLGDTLGPVIYDWMLQRKQIDPLQPTRKTFHLMTVGSIIASIGHYDATIWGSGIHTFKAVANISKRKRYRKFDIRAVRGPVTRDVLIANGYACPEVYGDPAVLMPYIYTPEGITTKEYEVSAILHFSQADKLLPAGINRIAIETGDYKHFIDEILRSKKVISSSLHGIILAESYGVPAVYLTMGKEELKFYDWYHSTGRRSVRVATTIEEALMMEPMELPDLNKMRNDLLNSFPYDLWEA